MGLYRLDKDRKGGGMKGGRGTRTVPSFVRKRKKVSVPVTLGSPHTIPSVLRIGCKDEGMSVGRLRSYSLDVRGRRGAVEDSAGKDSCRSLSVCVSCSFSPLSDRNDRGPAWGVPPPV